MARGIALNLGLNKLNPACYDGVWTGSLQGAIHDAEYMFALATSQGFQATLLTNEAVTREAVMQLITQASQLLQTGDIFLLSFAGHGGCLPDFSGDEGDANDETWCLYNGHLVDDELSWLWNQFVAGVRILIVADCCHSGTVTRDAMNVSRHMPMEVALATYKINREFYLQLKTLCCSYTEPLASVRLLSACSDNESTADNFTNGCYTTALKQVWNQGYFQGNYDDFYAQLVNILYPQQSPTHALIGAYNEDYNTQRPFTI